MESKSMGFAALDRAKALIEAIPDTKMSRLKTVRVADREWFEKNKKGVERVIGESIRLDKRQFLGKNIQNPQVQRDELAGYQNMDMEQYRPQVDDDAEVYIPISER